jgi:23S rRNA (uracil1939-C5)-methyltransferase
METRIRQDTSEQAQEYGRLSLKDIGPLGDTYADYNGEEINVFGGIPGEEVVARIVRYRRRRQRYVSGVVTEVLRASPHRVAPPCPYFGPCSGCQWQHIEYTHQLLLKQDAVRGHIRLYPELEGVQVSPTLPAAELFNYRNHARFTVRGQGSLGYINRITRRFVKVDECMLMDPWINEALELLQGNCEETTQLSIRYGVNTGGWLIQPTMLSVDIPLSSGQTHYREELLGHPFRISSPSFFQVNTKQTERLAELVRARLELSGSELLVDAYAGVGTFAVLFAPFARRVIAIEESAAALKDAAVNTLGVRNLEFVEGKTEEVLDSLDERPDAVIIDPPRVGCHPDALEALIRLTPGRVVYVSCDPETLARDLRLLVQGGFRVEAVEPVDMFPQTHHVECVATLSYHP